MGNFSEVSAEIDSTKTMVAAEEARAKGAEQGLSEAVAQNAGEIIALKGNSATKAELNAEAERAQSAEELISQQAELNFRNFSELGVEESAKIDGYEIALTKKTNTAQKTKVKVPVYDMQNPSATPVGLVDEIFVEDMKAEAKKMVDAEAERAQSAENANADAIAAEAERAGAKEQELSGELAAEAERAQSAEGTIMAKALDNAGRIETLETASATKAELATEAERASNAEKNIATLVQQNAGKIKILEDVSATKAELSAEAERAEGKEQEIEGKVAELESATNTGLATLGEYVSNPEWAKAVIDSEGKILWGIKRDGSVEFAKGVPTPIKNYVKSYVAEVDRVTDEEVERINQLVIGLLDNMEEVKSDINPIKNTFRYVSDSEWVIAIVDANNRILWGIKKDGDIKRNTRADEISCYYKTYGLSPKYNPNAPKPMLYQLDTFVQNAVAYPDGTIFYGDVSGNGITKMSPDGTRTKMLTITGANGGFRCIWMDSNYNIYAAPVVTADYAEVGGLYRLAYGEEEFVKVLDLYKSDSSVESETIATNATIWSMTEDKRGYIYAGVYVISANNPSIYRSKDGGLTWSVICDMNSYLPDGIHIHVIQYNPYDDALYCIVGEVNTILRSKDYGKSWQDMNVQLEHMKGTSMLCVPDGLIIGSDYAYWGMMYKVYADGSYRTTAKWWANAVFAIRQSDVTGWIYAFGVVDAAVKDTGYYPPADALTDASVLQEWLDSGPNHKGDWRAYHDSMVGLYNDDAIRPQHSAIMVSKDNGETWEVLYRIEGNSTGMPSVFKNGECAIPYFKDSKPYTIVISEGTHKYSGDGVYADGLIFAKISKLEYVLQIN
jgi:hypothetical protein